MAARLEAAKTEKLSGHIECDETYIGGYQKRENKNHISNKTVVIKT